MCSGKRRTESCFWIIRQIGYNAEELIRRYKKQLELYADALNRFGAGKTVKEILIYSFALAEEIVIQ